MIDYFGNIGVALNRADPAKLEALYRPSDPVGVVNVSEGTSALTTRLCLP